MKLTPEILTVLKYHGFITVIQSNDILLEKYKTVEDLASAGFVNDRSAFKLLADIFDENGVNQIGSLSDDESQGNETNSLEESDAVVEEKVIEPEPEPEPEPKDKKDDKPEKATTKTKTKRSTGKKTTKKK